MRLNHDLVSLLKMLEERADDEDKKAIGEVLQNVRPIDCITCIHNTT